MGNPLHVLGVVHHGLIVWNLLKSSFKIHEVLSGHPCTCVMDDYPEIGWSRYLWTNTVHAHILSAELLSLRSF